MSRKTIFITGAASGIGAATARRFARAGWFCVLTDIDAPGLAALQKELGTENAIIHVFDVRERAGWREAMTATERATGGHLDLLFNNAGIAKSGPLDSISPTESDAIVDINLKGVINGVYAALPLLEATQGARIINVSSVAGVIGAPHLAVYAATKWGVRGFTEALDVELSGRGIRVHSLMPWFLDTPILDKGFSGEGQNRPAKDEMADMGIEIYPVELAAEAAWKAAFSDKLHHTVGKRAKEAAIGMRLFPDATRKRLRRQLAAQVRHRNTDTGG